MDLIQVYHLALFLSGGIACLLIYSCTTTPFYGTQFQHPVLMALIIFLGESLNLIIYRSVKKIRENRMEGTGNTHILTDGDVIQYKQTTLFAIGALDSISSITLITGIGFTYPTILLLLSPSSLIVVHLLAYWYRENYGKTHHWIGVLLISIGMILTIIFRIFLYEDSRRNIVITGMLLIIFGTCIKGISMNILDHNFKSLNNPALSVTGLKGLYGFLVTIALYIFFNFVKVGLPNDDYLDNVRSLPSEIGKYPGIVFACIFLSIVSTIYEASALMVIKNVKPENRITIDTFRIILICPISLILGWEPEFLLIIGSGILTLFGLFVFLDSTILIKMYKALFIHQRRSAFNVEESSNITQSSPSDTA